MAIKPNLKCTKFAQYKAEYEEKIAIAEAHIGKALEDRSKVEAVHNTLLAQKNELVLALQSGGSAVQEIIDKPPALKAKLQRFRMNSVVSRPASRVKKPRKLLWKVKLERSMPLFHRWKLKFRTKKES